MLKSNLDIFKRVPSRDDLQRMIAYDLDGTVIKHPKIAGKLIHYAYKKRSAFLMRIALTIADRFCYLNENISRNSIKFIVTARHPSSSNHTYRLLKRMGIDATVMFNESAWNIVDVAKWKVDTVVSLGCIFYIDNDRELLNEMTKQNSKIICLPVEGMI